MAPIISCKISQQFYMLVCVWTFYLSNVTPVPLQWHHDEHYGISDRWHLACLLNCLLRRRSKKTPKICVTGIWEGNSLMTDEFPTQNVSIRLRHHMCKILCWFHHSLTKYFILIYMEFKTWNCIYIIFTIATQIFFRQTECYGNDDIIFSMDIFSTLPVITGTTHGWPSTQPGSLHTALQCKYTQSCSLFSRGTAVSTMGARLCQQWGTAVCKCPAV